jgi:hypothetical protein
VLTTNDRAKGVGDAADKGKNGPVLGVLLERHLVGQDGARHNVNTGSSDALKPSAQEENGKRISRSPRAQGAADKHEDHGNVEGGVSSEYIGQLGPAGDESGGREVEGGHDPVELLDLAKVTSNPGQGAGDAW